MGGRVNERILSKNPRAGGREVEGWRRQVGVVNVADAAAKSQRRTSFSSKVEGQALAAPEVKVRSKVVLLAMGACL